MISSIEFPDPVVGNPSSKFLLRVVIINRSMRHFSGPISDKGAVKLIKQLNTSQFKV
jgi:hypothetical protein